MSSLLVSLVLFHVGPAPERTAEELRQGIALFQAVVEKECRFRPAFQVSEARWVKVPTEAGAKLERGDGGEPYERALGRLIERHDLAATKGITLLSVGLDRHCGFAFPDVRFPKSRLRNHVLLDPSAQGGCHNRRRILAHELAHLFLEDEPPHTCLVDGERGPCPEENLLAVTRLVRRLPPLGNRGLGDPVLPPPDPFNDLDFLGARREPAIGTSLAADQCETIRKKYAALAGE